MPLDPSLDLSGDPSIVKVSASDVSGACACGRFLALKTRPRVKAIGGWQRLFPQKGRSPFPLGDILDLLCEADGQDFGTYAAQSAWLAEAISRRNVHRLFRSYVELAVENILEAHESIEADVGPLRLLATSPQVGSATRKLTAWAPLYHGADGLREIRRFRLGSVKEEDDDSRRWTLVAAYVAAEYRAGPPPTRVRVVEIGAVDGSVKVLFNNTAAEARSQFKARGRGLVVAVAEEDHVVPCRSCGECKTAGSCGALVSVAGVLGQAGRGYESRSVSPRDLEQYARCPAQWLLDGCLHLPSDDEAGDGSARGLAVHIWLRAAHARGLPCMASDLPEPGSGLGLAADILTEDEYEAAYPFLVQHATQCPLSGSAELVLADENVYGYDHHAEVVPAIRPDLMYRAGDRLVIREIKTAQRPYEQGKAEAYDRHLQIAFGIAMLNSGLIRHYGASSGAVELELITSTESLVWTWDAADPAVAAVAAGTVASAAADWHEDGEWPTQPGPHCDWCPVRRWCPDRDAWQSETPGRAVLATAAPPASSDDAEAPF